MSGRIATGVFVSLLALSAGGSAQGQTPARDARVTAPAAPAGTAALSGIVVSSTDNTKLIRLAPVVIIGTTTGVLKVTSTDASGRFSFVGLPADRYLVGASKPPYLGAVAGAKRPARPGTPVALADGQKITNVTIQLPPGAAISGTITDERGQPASNVSVNLMQARMQNGERVLTIGPGSASTDERGRYRMYGLAPGEYVVVAYPRSGPPPGTRALTDAQVDAALKAAQSAQPGAPGQPSGTPPGPPASGPAAPSNVTYAPVYFPGTTRGSNAGPITLGVGDDRQGIDLRLELVRTAKIEGTVSGIETLPAAIAIRGVTTGPTPFGTSNWVNRVMPDGRFTMPSVMPGSYTFIANTMSGPAPLFAIASVEVSGADQSGVLFAFQPPLSFGARIAFAGAAPAPSLAGYRIPIRVVPPAASGAPAPQVAPTSATGALTVTGVLPGRYIIGGPLYFGANASSLTWALESVTVDGRDVTDLPIDIGPDAVPKDVVITYGDRSQELSGRLQLASGAAATDYTIVVFPADKAYWIPGSRRILTTHSGTDGQFRLGGPGLITLPAGDYLLAAVSELDRDEQFDPAFLTSLQTAAVRVTVKPGGKTTQNLLIK